ncbi:MAG: GDSL-type esterase/lipase family protein [Micrococcales bacterium]|nr:GDSL-type esterase/lipase family protein [Micrococcales bacterium]MCL2667075.1 GDSL-type esterase/lipase family protein [Micrococcales bacterium]
MRIVVVGDELVAGVGDPKALGWVGRVVARTIAPEPPLVLTLAMPGETSTHLAARWEAEALGRLDPGSDNRLVVALGRGDGAAGLSLARSRLNLAKILDAAAQHRIPAFVVGPPPAHPDANMHLAALSAAFSDVADRRTIPYVETFAPLVAHDQWLADLASSDGSLPGQAGYGLIAWLVLHTGWHAWLGLPSDAD